MGRSRYKKGKSCIIHPAAIVHDDVILGNDVRIGPWTVIYDGVRIGNGTFVGPGVILGEPIRSFYHDPSHYTPNETKIGRKCVLRAHSTVYSGTVIGDEFECGTCVSIRENAVIGSGCRIGNYSDIQGECSIGEGCRLHSSVHIAQFSTIGSYVWMFPYVLLLNAPVAPIPNGIELRGPTIGDYSVLMVRTLIMAGVELGKHVVVAANSRVTKNVSSWSLVKGDPATVVCDSRQYVFKREGHTYKPYPWMLHRMAGSHWEKDVPTEWLMYLQEDMKSIIKINKKVRKE